MPIKVVTTRVKIAINILTVVLISSIVVPYNHSQTHAETKCEDATYFKDNFDECTKVIDSYTSKLAKIRSQQTTIDAQIKDYLTKLNVTDVQIESLRKDIAKVSAELKIIEENLADRRGSLGKKTQIRNTIVRDFYKFGQPTILEVLLSGSGGQAFAVRDIFEDSVGREAVKSIISLNMEIADFESDKKEAGDLRASLESSQSKLLSLKADIDRKKAQAVSTVAELDKKGDSYEKTIAELSAKQQAILQAKSGDFSASLSSGVETDDSRSSPNYNPGFSPAFAAFSYGAYTHRNGMSQYGAKGRAEAGQDYKEILEFYYKAGVKKIDISNISVSGYGKMDMQKYLYGLAEMPGTWPADALKAQAIAGRSYAYRYAKDGKTICTDQHCQVFLKSKSDNPPSAWKKAVDDTKGVILDSSVVAYYSSTTGGWINNVGWDLVKDGSWPNDSYEKKAGSYWFFKAWFTEKTSTKSSTCGLSNPWLDSEEMSDILNAYILIKAGKDTDRILPETIGKCPVGGMSGDPYSKSEMRTKSEKYGGGFSKVTGVSTPVFNAGYTSQITFTVDGKNITVDGQLFMKAFNLRAPGYTAIKYSPDSKGIFSILKK